MNKNLKTLRIILSSYAILLALFKLSAWLTIACMVLLNRSTTYYYSSADLLIACLLIVVAIGLYRNAWWSVYLYIFSMGMVYPDIIDSFRYYITASDYFYAAVLFVIVLLTGGSAVAVVFIVKANPQSNLGYDTKQD